jgi:hypothetical protein
MTLEPVRAWFLVLLAAAAASAPAPAQTLAPDDATPRGPLNPFTPPPCTGTVFTDVTCSSQFDPWIEQYAGDQITGGCGGGNYCPNAPVTRAQMAVFVEKAMRGTASWSPGNLGNDNTALGSQALLSVAPGPVVGTGNTALGSGSLWENTTGYQNTAVGYISLLSNLNGNQNTAIGADSLTYTTTSNNTAIGYLSLFSNETGFDDTAIGWNAGTRADVITGYNGSSVQLVANVTGSYNTFLGITGATAQVDNCTAVGMDAYCDATNQVRLGNVFVTSIGGKVAWSALSDARAKSDVRDLDLGLDFVLALRPVAYRYTAGNGRTDLGFVAQDVEALLGDGYNLVDIGGDADRTLSLRYTDLIAPLVRAVQQQQAGIEARDARIAGLEEQASAQEARLGALERELEELRLARASAAGRASGR